ncbi:MAG: YicC family protein [Muribaculaceae bacterium]|nr:YicC family protein [Muribaculaceae bacterium]
MLMSMTGFGKSTVEAGAKKITVEIKSLNSKQMDLNLRLPYAFREHELDLRSAIGRSLERGKADVIVNVENIGVSSEIHSTLDVAALAAYKKQIEEASAALGIPTPADWYSVLLRFPDTISTTSPEAADADQIKALDKALAQAVDNLSAHRRAEGIELEKFFAARIATIASLLESIEPFEAERVPKIRQKIEESLSKINVPDYDKGRLEQEMIFYIEKLDVNEEKQRLRKHLQYFLETMEAANGGQGKKLGFIAQEMGREINTLGSKSNHAEMQAIVVRMKDSLEQIKEQVLNVL